MIEVLFCGVCHSDIHQVRDEWSGAIFPMVPGHEIVGRVTRVGAEVAKFKVGDVAGVGCMVDSCRSCAPCREDLEQFCEKGIAPTYNGTEMDRKTLTFGGYSTEIVVDERSRGSRSRCCRAAPLRGDHHVLAASPVRVQAG